MARRYRFSRYFDRQDKDIRALVNRILDAPDSTLASLSGDLADPELHPHGIKEMVTSQASRMAYATVNLLRNLEVGGSSSRDRICALQSLFDEVLASAHSPLRRNTARVLLQIMKDMVRAQGDPTEQLKLAHDFRKAALGTPRVVRRMLARYHLPEMPEEWNQIAFDDHVYDVNTKGRKTPTHLIMDAWIKGLRSLTVLYDNCIELDAAEELLDAAGVTGMTVRVGIEYQVPFYDRFVSFLWVPRGFVSRQGFLDFMNSAPVQKMQARGRAVLHWWRERALKALDLWNARQRPELESRWGVSVAPADADDFLDFLGRRHSVMLRLAEYLHQLVLPSLRLRARQLEAKAGEGDEEARGEIRELELLTVDVIYHDWFASLLEGELPDARIPGHAPDMPELRTVSAADLTRQLRELMPGYQLTLCTENLTAEDVIELLWDCQGGITHLEIFNTKSWMLGQLGGMESISQLLEVLNHGHGPRMKQMIRHIIRRLAQGQNSERLAKFQEILRNVPKLWETYRRSPLRTQLGSNAATRLRSFGMGFAILETLPPRGVAALRHEGSPCIPIHVPVEEKLAFVEPEHAGRLQRLLSRCRSFPFLAHLGKERRREWISASAECRYSEHGNIHTLGGYNIPAPNDLLDKEAVPGGPPGWRYLNTGLTLWAKVLVGFIPAFFTFQATQQWWVLAWFGSFIWFGITGVRNVLQMVMAAQGATRGTLTHWKEHVSMSRLCDSLMYTGISVLLLEGIVRVGLLQRLCGVTVEDQPLLVFAVLNIINGFYIFAHNIYRGFPRQAAIGNLFRSVLAIPISSLYNAGLWGGLLALGVADPLAYLAPSAAIVSKMASDTVAALIEGLADSKVNMRMRRRDYDGKLRRAFDCYTRLEMLFPREDALIKLARPGGLGERGGREARKLERALIIAALDFMYFWFYLPRAQEVCRQVIRGMSPADRRVFFRSQLVLLRERDICQLMVDGLVGHNFSKPLAFFLDRHGEYLRAMTQLCRNRVRKEGNAQPEAEAAETV